MKIARSVLSGLFLIAICPGLAAQLDDVRIETIPVGGNVYMLKGRGGNIGASVGNDGIVLIDDQFAPLTPKIRAALGEISDGAIRFVINTHYHGDHVGGNEQMGDAGSVIVAHDNIRARMSTEQFNLFLGSTTPPYPASALPVVTFNDRVSLHFNGEAVTSHHVPQGHTDGDSIVHFPHSNVIHMGDLFFNGLYPFVDLDGGGSIQGIIAGCDLALSMAAEDTMVIPGHGPLATVQDLQLYREFLAEARDRVQKLMDQGMTLQQAIAAKPTAKWDEQLGKTWITPPQFVTFIYNSLKGIHEYTPASDSD